MGCRFNYAVCLQSCQSPSETQNPETGLLLAGWVPTSREKHASDLRHGDYMCGLVTMVGHMPGLNVFAETVSRPVRRRDGRVDDTEH